LERGCQDEGECSGCLNAIGKSDTYLKCDVLCASLIHVECTPVPNEVHKALTKYLSVVGYVCEECRSSMKATHYRLYTAVNVLTEELAKQRAEVEQLQLKDINHSPPMTTGLQGGDAGGDGANTTREANHREAWCLLNLLSTSKYLLTNVASEM